MRKALSVLLLIAASLSVTNCTKNYPTSYVYDSIKTANANSILIKFSFSESANLSIYANQSLVAYIPNGSASFPDTIRVPDSSRLDAYWGTNHIDTIALPGLIWTIQ